MNYIFPSLMKPTVLVLGDVMVDHGIHGTCAKIANEGPIPVLHQHSESYSLGGAANVAANVASMGANVYLGAVIGKDYGAKKLLELTNAHNITFCGVQDESVTTTVKHRGFAGNKLLFRYDDEAPLEKSHISDTLLDNIGQLIALGRIDSIIISDYNKGYCYEEFVSMVISWAHEMNIPVIIDPKGDFGKYSCCTLLKPNFHEAQKECGLPLTPYDRSAVPNLMDKLSDKVACPYICITLASQGMALYDRETRTITYYDTQPVQVHDVTGAGDVVCATFGFLSALKTSNDIMAKAATFLASRSVQHVGTHVCDRNDFWALHTHLHPGKVINLETLSMLPRDNCKIIFSNGCFDMLHASHVASLTYAKSLGDILIVGINSDESIQRLKGHRRPIVPLDQRIKMLEALQCVDYIIPFDTDSPIDIVKYIKPDVMVKGQEYEGIPMRSSAHAGETIFFPMQEGVSTSRIIERVLDRYTPPF